MLKYIVYQDQNREWRWYLQSANKRKLAHSGEGYENRVDCLAAIQLVKGSGAAPVEAEALIGA